MDPTACDKYDLPETNLRMCTRSPNIYGHDTSQPRTLVPQGLMKRRSLSKQKDSDSDSSSSSSSDESDTNGKVNKQRVKKLRRKRRCMQICLILVAIVIVLIVTNTINIAPTSKPLMAYMPSWNNYT